MNKKMRVVLAGAGLFLLLIVAAVVFVPDTDDGETERPGSAAVYAEIEASTDCAALGRTIDTAYENHERYPFGDPMRAVTLSYMQTATERMEDIGCP